MQRSKGLNIKKDLIKAVMRRKLGLFGLENNRNIKDVVKGMMYGIGRRGRPSREWMYDIHVRNWCQTDVHRPSLLAQAKESWKMLIKICIGHLRGVCPWIMMMMMMM